MTEKSQSPQPAPSLAKWQESLDRAQSIIDSRSPVQVMAMAPTLVRDLSSAAIAALQPADEAKETAAFEAWLLEHRKPISRIAKFGDGSYQGAEVKLAHAAWQARARGSVANPAGDEGTVGLRFPDGRVVWGRPVAASDIAECYGDCRIGDPAGCPYPCKFEGRPGSTAGEDDIDWPDVQELARSACEEALAFGVGYDVFYRRMRDVMDKTANAVRAAIGRRVYAADGRANTLARDLASSRDCVSEWVAFGAAVTEALGLRVMSPKGIMAEIARLREVTPLPTRELQLRLRGEAAIFDGCGMPPQDLSELLFAAADALKRLERPDAHGITTASVTVEEMDAFDAEVAKASGDAA